MASRLRFLIELPSGDRVVGQRAVAAIRRCTYASPDKWPNVSWDNICAEGIRKRYWSQLYVWRERRGIKNSLSQFHRDSRRQGLFPPAVRVARTEAANRRQRAEIAARQLGRQRGAQRLSRAILDVPEAGPRRIRPGIFA